MNCPSAVKCERCTLADERKLIVDGRGPLDATLMVVGEGPGREEDETGLPFVGASGQDIRTELELNGIDCDDIFITNSVKCRPPHNRDPKADELDECRPWLTEEINVVRPKVILCLGAFAKKTARLAIAAGEYRPEHVIDAWHPAAFMYKPDPKKRMVWRRTIKLAADLALGRELESTEVQLEDWGCFENDESTLDGLLSSSAILSLDTEYRTEGPDVHIIPDLVSWSLGDSHRSLFVDDPVHSLDWLQRVWDWCDAGGILGGSNFIQADIPVCEKVGITITDTAKLNVRDTMIDAYVLREEEVGLKPLARKYGRMDVLAFKDVAPVRKKKRLQFDEVLADPKLRPVGVLYGGQDAVAGARTLAALDPLLKPDQRERLAAIEYPLAHILSKMHVTGVLLDRDAAIRMQESLHDNIDRESRNAWDVLGAEVYLGSGKPLADALIALGLPLTARTKSGELATDAKNLELARDKLIEAEAYPEAIKAVKYVTEARKATKNAQFVDGLIDASEFDGRVHTTFRQAGSEHDDSDSATQGPATGRLSSADPNLQNIPRRSMIGKLMRKLFIPSPGYRWVSGDLNQVELRFFAHYTQAPVLLDAFRTGKKVHQSVADELMISYDEAKTLVYAILYGVEADKVARQMGWKRAKAEAFLKRMRERLPEILDWKKWAEAELMTSGHIEVMGGWYAYYPEYFGTSARVQAGAVREAANAKLQGAAATLMKHLHVELDKHCEAWGGRTLLQVHDELNCELPEDVAGDFAKRMEEVSATFGDIYELSVPIVMEAHAGLNWGDVH